MISAATCHDTDAVDGHGDDLLQTPHEHAGTRCGNPAVPKAYDFQHRPRPQFTRGGWIDPLTGAQVQISMDGKGRWIDNVFIERLWRNVKYESTYLHAYQNGTDQSKGLREYFEFYNVEQVHQALGYQTPDERYYGCAALKRAA